MLIWLDLMAKVIKTKVADGIHKAEELIDKAVNGDAPIYHGGDGSHNESNEESESGFRKVYKHLMNGVSNMLPFVIGGGILIAITFYLMIMLLTLQTLVQIHR